MFGSIKVVAMIAAFGIGSGAYAASAAKAPVAEDFNGAGARNGAQARAREDHLERI